MSQSALVIGGTGFLGAAVVAELRAAGWDVTSLARGRMPNPTEDVPLLVADRAQPGALAEATRGREFELVVDCAAYLGPHAAEAVAAFAESTKLYVFISTDFVYAPAADARFPLREDAAKTYDLPYAAGKLDCEAVLLQAWQERRFPAVILRPPHILGAGKPLGCDPLEMRKPALLDEMRAGRELTLLAEGQLLVQPVWNREIGACIAHLAQHENRERAYGRVCNCAGPDAVTTRRYYEIIAQYLGVPLRFRSVSLHDFVAQSPDKAHMARHRIYDLSSLRESTGYVPQLHLEDALAATAGGQA